jgi:hypothetical protein
VTIGLARQSMAPVEVTQADDEAAPARSSSDHRSILPADHGPNRPPLVVAHH